MAITKEVLALYGKKVSPIILEKRIAIVNNAGGEVEYIITSVHLFCLIPIYRSVKVFVSGDQL